MGIVILLSLGAVGLGFIRQPSALPLTPPTYAPPPTLTAPQLLARGQILIQAGREAAGALYLEQALAQNPNLMEAYRERGELFARQENYPAAIQDFTRLIQHDPTNPEPYIARGMALFALGNTGAALTDFDQAIGLDAPPQAYYGRGLVYWELGEFEFAQADWAEYLLLAPDDAVGRAEIENRLASLEN